MKYSNLVPLALQWKLDIASYCNGETYEDLVVTNGDKPTEAEVEQACLDYEAEQKATEYKRLRESEYPTLEECIHALLDGGDTLVELNAKRQAVKLKYPKI